MSRAKLRIEKLGFECNEAYKALRTNLQFCGEDKKVIVFTSCTPDEGKSTVATYLALSMAQAGKKVLLVDGDLRKSLLLGNFVVTGETKGLTHYLSGQAELKDIIRSTNLEKLDVIFAGPVPPNPTELLGDDLFREMAKSCREMYDYVFIDSPPLGSVIDSAIIANACDGSIIVIESEVISYRFVLEIKEQLEKSNCPILGTIINKVDIREQKYYSRYYGRKYGKYYTYGNYGKKEKSGISVNAGEKKVGKR